MIDISLKNIPKHVFTLPTATDRRLAPFWSTELQSTQFMLQKYHQPSNTVAKSLLKTVTSLLDVKQPQYRVVFQREINAICLVIASCDSYELIQQAWTLIQQNIVPELNDMEDTFSKEEWVIVQMNAIVSATITEKEADELVKDHTIRNASRLFRERFNIQERLVNYYACMCNGRQGWIYFTENYMAFYSYLMGLETKIPIELKQVKAITKELPKNRLDQSLRIITKSDEEYLLGNLFKREEMYQLLLQLTNLSIKRVLKNSDSPSLTNKPPAITTEALTCQTENKSYALKSILEKQKCNQDLQIQFRLSYEEEILDMLEVSYFYEKEADPAIRASYQKVEFPGTFYQTTHFLIFQSDEKLSTSEQPICSFVLPFYSIIKCEKTKDNTFEFFTWKGAKRVIKVKSERTAYAAFCDILREGLCRDKPETKRLSEKCLATCKSEDIMSSTANVPCGLGDIFGYISDIDQAKNDKKINSWKWYFKENERNLTLVRQPAFARMIRSGIPNVLRGEIWELCSGSMFLRFRNANLYEDILELHKDQACPFLREIEKDLHRSLPEYEAYQNEKGIEKLRRVLVAYAWKNPEIGYCQAMNIITSAMLIFMAEEQVFWILNSLVDQLCPGYYSSSMYGVLLDQIVLKEIVKDALPEIHNHLEVQDMRLEVASLPWFLTLFVNSIPLQYAFRIIDCFFLEGPKVLFQITLGLYTMLDDENKILTHYKHLSIAILYLNKSSILETEDDSELLVISGNYFRSINIASSEEADKMVKDLLRIALSNFGYINSDAIIESRKKNELKIVENAESITKRNTLNRLKSQASFTQEEVSVLYDHFFNALYYTQNDQSAQAMGMPAFKVLLKSLTSWHNDQNPNVIAFGERLFQYFKTEKGIYFSQFVQKLESLIHGDILDQAGLFFLLYDIKASNIIAGIEISDMLVDIYWIVYTSTTQEIAWNLIKSFALSCTTNSKEIQIKLAYAFETENSDQIEEIRQILRDAQVFELTLPEFQDTVLQNDAVKEFIHSTFPKSFKLETQPIELQKSMGHEIFESLLEQGWKFASQFTPKIM